MDRVLFGRRVDSPLDDGGILQAARLAERLAWRALEPVILTSPRRRTRQTAEAIAARIGADTRVRAELDEIDFGRWSGQTFESLQSDSEWRTWNIDRAHASTPAGETIADVQARALSLIEAFAADPPSRAVAFVTHSEVIRSVVLHCLGLSAERYDLISIEPASVTTIRFENGLCRLDTMNERLAS